MEVIYRNIIDLIIKTGIFANFDSFKNFVDLKCFDEN